MLFDAAQAAQHVSCYLTCATSEALNSMARLTLFAWVVCNFYANPVEPVLQKQKETDSGFGKSRHPAHNKVQHGGVLNSRVV